jgi:hypothetical protein
MEERAGIAFCVKLKKVTIEAFEMLKVRTVKNIYLEQVYSNDIKGSTNGESRYMMMNGKAALELTEQKNGSRSKVFGHRPNFECPEVRRNYR